MEGLLVAAAEGYLVGGTGALRLTGPGGVAALAAGTSQIRTAFRLTPAGLTNPIGRHWGAVARALAVVAAGAGATVSVGPTGTGPAGAEGQVVAAAVGAQVSGAGAGRLASPLGVAALSTGAHFTLSAIRGGVAGPGAACDGLVRLLDLTRGLVRSHRSLRLKGTRGLGRLVDWVGRLDRNHGPCRLITTGATMHVGAVRA